MDDIGIGRGAVQVDKDGKAHNIYGTSNADRNFVKKFETQAQIAEQ